MDNEPYRKDQLPDRDGDEESTKTAPSPTVHDNDYLQVIKQMVADPSLQQQQQQQQQQQDAPPPTVNDNEYLQLIEPMVADPTLQQHDRVTQQQQKESHQRSRPQRRYNHRADANQSNSTVSQVTVPSSSLHHENAMCLQQDPQQMRVLAACTGLRTSSFRHQVEKQAALITNNETYMQEEKQEKQPPSAQQQQQQQQPGAFSGAPGQGLQQQQKARFSIFSRASNNNDNPAPIYEVTGLDDNCTPNNLDESMEGSQQKSDANTDIQGTEPGASSFEQQPPNTEGLATATLVTGESTLHLPQVAPVDSDAKAEASRQKQIRKRKVALLIAGSLVLIVLGVILALAFTLPNKDKAVHVTELKYTLSPTMAPTLSLRGYIMSLLPDYTLQVLSTDGDSVTPQSNALDWLMQDPVLDTYQDWRIVQKFALATFFYATGGHNSWINNENWLNHSVHECLWFARDTFDDYDGYNVTEYPNPCMEENPAHLISGGLLQHLWLWENGLQGTLPPELYLLTELKSVGIDSNKGVRGTISPLIGELRSLEAIAVTGTDISGTLPTEAGLLQNLTGLFISYNNLTGGIPSELGQLTKLLRMEAEINSFTSTIPTELGLLTELVWIFAESNALVGSIPTELGRLTDMIGLSLDSNQLISRLPTELGLLTKLSWLILFENSLTGCIPSELGLMTHLEDLQLHTNQITATIPTELGLLTKLSLLYLFDNALVGSIPTELGLLTLLEDLAVEQNQLTSSIPTELGMLTALLSLYLMDNFLLGSIPTELGRLAAMDTLALEHNQLTSSIPTEVGMLPNLWNLYLRDNDLAGSVPSELGRLTNLEDLLLFSNQLTSTLPTELGLLTSLVRFMIDDNYLTGNIPTELGLLLNLTTPPWESFMIGLGLNDNLFEGKIPSEIGQLSNLPALWLQQNQLSGKIPEEIFALAINGSLVSLNMTGNQLLSGTIPDYACFMHDLDFDCTALLCGCKCVCQGPKASPSYNYTSMANETGKGGGGYNN